MRKLLFILAFVLIGTSGFTSNETEKKSVVVEQSTNETKCYNKKIDDFGNVYYEKVECPDIIIITTTSEVQ